jgi:hypothetical protein
MFKLATESELLTQIVKEMQACGLTDLQSDRGRRTPRRERERAQQQIEGAGWLTSDLIHKDLAGLRTGSP